jgi:Mycothiol maleylpyruvate isomerase N-terminal domain
LSICCCKLHSYRHRRTNTNDTAAGSRSRFAAAAICFNELVGQVAASAWVWPALGVWNVRDLVGHTSRALSTIDTYLDKEPTGDAIDGPVAYFLAARAALADADAVARRGREAGAALGEDPAAAIADLARLVTARVDATSDDALVATPVGPMTLAAYLPTRTFELTVHSLDLARALALVTPAALGPAVTACCELAGRVAGQLPQAPELLLALTGRNGLPEGLSIV